MFYNILDVTKIFHTKIFIVSFIIILLFTSCESNSWQLSEGIVWNTVYHIQWKGSASLSDSILPMLKDIASSVSVFDNNSIVSKINRGENPTIDFHFRKILEVSKQINFNSEGAFDPTVSPLINAWGFGYEECSYPDSIRISQILKYIGIERTEIRYDHTLLRPDSMQFNFSAIAKGYGCDVIGEMFNRNGVSNWLIEIGGEIAMSGKSRRGENWCISIDRPILSNSAEIHKSEMVISLSDCGVATSGDYRNYKDTPIGRIAHTINPKTGMPASTDVISATIIASTAMEADAYATACMAMGSIRAKSMANKQALPMMLILRDSSVWMSNEFKLYVK